MNTYDNEAFFSQYAQMSRSVCGLDGAGEWHQLKLLFPDLKGRRVLDLGCGYGWHSFYAAQQGAETVLGLDLSEKMIAEAKSRNAHPRITYQTGDLEAYEYPAESWDVVISNLVLHYIADLEGIFRRIYRTLAPGGVFVLNIEHPTFTAGVHQDWVYDDQGRPLHWPVDNYYREGPRTTNFLGCQVEKQHHTLTTIVGGLLAAGFTLEALVEAQPPESMMDLPGMADELRRPMMLLIRVRK